MLLYELLTETTPFESSRLREAGYDEMRRIIREEDPPMPSTRVSTMGRDSETVAAQRKTDARRMSQQLRGELDWIVIKALDKKRGRRYQTAKEFAEDVQRYLDGEPVAACPPSVLYRVRKTLGKYRGLVATAAALTLLLVAGAVVSTVFAVRAMRAESRAEAAQTAAETISDFLSNELLGQASPYENPKRDLQLREVLDQASERIEGHFDKQPLVEAQIRMTLGRTYRHLGEYETADKHLRRAYRLRREELGEDHPETLESAFELGVVQLYRGQDDEASVSLERVLRLQQRTLGHRHADTLATMGWLALGLSLQRDFEAAEPLFAQANAGFEQLLGRDHPDALDCLDATARMYHYQRRFEEAEALQTEILDTRRRVLGEDHPQVADSVSALAAVKLLQRETEEALALYDQAARLREQAPGGQHPGTLQDMRQMATRLLARRRHEAAERLYLDNFQAQREQYGVDDERTLWTMSCLASLYWALGRYDDAEPIRLQIVDSRRRVLGDGHQETLNALDGLGVLHTWQKRYEDALKLFREIVETNMRLRGPDDVRTIAAVERLAYGLQGAKHFEAATQLMQEQLAGLTERLGSDAPETLTCKLRLAFIHKAHRKYDAAEARFRELWESKAFGEEHPKTLQAGNQLAVALRRLGRLGDAAAVCREALEARITVLGRNQLDTSSSFYEMATICGELGRYKARARFLVSFTKVRCKISGPGHTWTLRGFYDLIDLADFHEQQGNIESSRQLRQRIEELALELLAGDQAGSADGRLALAEVKLRLNQVEEAIDTFSEVVDSRRAAFGEADERTVTAIERLASAYLLHQSYEDALRDYRHLADLKTRMFGADDPRTIETIIDLLDVVRRLKQPEEAGQLVETLIDRLGKDHPRVIEARRIQADAHLQADDFVAAIKILEGLWHAPLDVLDADSGLRIRAGGKLVDALHRNHQLAQAEQLARELLSIRKRVSGDDSREVAHWHWRIGNICRDLGVADEAAEHYEAAYRIRCDLLGVSESRTRQVISDLLAYADRMFAQKDFHSAWKLYKSALAVSIEARGDTHPSTLQVSGQLARSYAEAGKHEEAYETFRRDVELLRLRGIHEEVFYSHLVQAAEVLIKLKRHEEAEAMLRECLRDTEERAPEHPVVPRCLARLGEVLVAAERFDEAEPILVRSHQLLADTANRDRAQYRRSLERLVAFYQSTSRDELAAEWAQKLKHAAP